MQIEGTTILVTGGGGGIGEALCRRFHAAGAGAIAVVDRDPDKARHVAARIGGLALHGDMGRESDVRAVIRETEQKWGPIDLYCSNAGILRHDPAGETCVNGADADWEDSWNVNVMAHVYAARALLPGMIARGRGYFLITASAAGLLNQIGSAPYGTTKHAAIGFAENLAIAHGDDGIKVSVLCPQAVDTPMARGAEGHPAALDGILSADDVAEHVVRGLSEEKFLILPHPEVLTYIRHKAADYDRWLAAMRRLRRQTPGLS